MWDSNPAHLVYEAAWAKPVTQEVVASHMGVASTVAERAKKYASCAWGRAAWPLVGVERCRF